MRAKRWGRFLIVVVVLIAWSSAFQSASADPQANKEVSRRVNQEAWSQGQLAVVDEVVGPDYVYHEPALGDIRGPEGLKQTILGYRTAYPDLQFTIDDLIAQGDLVALRWTAAGTHEDELMGIPATGLETTTTGINIMRFNADGMVVEEWSTWDVIGLMQQLGAVPADRDEYIWGEPSSVTGDGGNPQANTVKVISYTEEVWNRKRVDQLEVTHSSDVVVHNPMLPGQPVDIDRYRDATEGFIVNMPDLNVEFHRFVAEGDMVAAHYTTTGTHLPSGKKITLPGVTWYRLADGKVVETWWMYDAYGMMQQIMAPPEWTPEGMWAIGVPSPMGDMNFIQTIYPLDKAGGRYGGILWQVNPNPTFFGTFPDFNGGSQFWATEIVRTAPNTYTTGMIVYDTKPAEGLLDQVGSIGVGTATWTITGPDTNEGQTVVSIYMAEQDADKDGLPDAGQVPVACTPFPFTSKRIKIMPACVPPPTE